MAETVTETVEESYDNETDTEFRKKTVRRSMKIQETSSTTKTVTTTTPAKLTKEDEVDVDDLLAKLSEDELNLLAKEVDPDDPLLPPSLRCNYACEKDPTGPVDRPHLIEHINKEALETPDLPENEPFEPGKLRGKKYEPPLNQIEEQVNEQIAIDLGSEYEHALTDATQEEIIDLAAILGFHSMMNQDQYYASLLNKDQPIGMGWDGITKASKQKIFPRDAPNTTDVRETIKNIEYDDANYIDINFNNIKTISKELFENFFKSLQENTYVESISLANTGMTDAEAELLAQVLEKNNIIKVVNVESNNLTSKGIIRLLRSFLVLKSVQEFRASNQRSSVLGNKSEMEITSLIEENPTLIKLGLHLEYNDARSRILQHLQKNIDQIRKDPTIRPKFRLYHHRERPHIF